MKKIGLIGGMSWESSLEYYRLINRGVQQALGGYHSARIIMESVDFAEIETMQQSGAWAQAGDLLGACAFRLERAGADAVLLCTNTMHTCADAITKSITVPFIHIADATAEEIIRKGIRKVGLLGTRFTMEREFYRGRLESRYGLNVIVPEAEEREQVHRVIYDELVRGIIRPESHETYLQVINGLRQAGAGGIILGCTEIGLLVREGDVDLPLFDTTLMHARAAVDISLSNEG